MDAIPEPKQRNPVRTKARILARAFDLFASRGYARTGMRDIAEAAEVAKSLVVRYFGTKSALFEQSLVNALHTRGFFIREKQCFGERMAELVVNAEDAQIPAMVMLAIADVESREIARSVTREVIIKTLAEWLGPPDATARALHMLILLNGFTLQTRHLMAEDVRPETIRWLANSLQAIVDGDLPTAPR
jgi:AcrR family transcriptional regulator